MQDMITNTEKSMDVLNAHKSKAKTSIARIGAMVSIVDFSSLLHQHGLNHHGNDHH
jgi:hypothetical protein